MFTTVKINEFQTYWPITQTQVGCHNAISPFGYRTYYLRMLPRYGTLSKGWFYDFFYSTYTKGFISFPFTCKCGDCWVYIFDDLTQESDEKSGIGRIYSELMDRMIVYNGHYNGLPLPDLEIVHPINKYVVFSLGVFSGDWQYNKLIEREI